MSLFPLFARFAKYKYLLSVILSGWLLGAATFCVYFFLDERDSVSAFYGTCMLISLQGQDEPPEDFSAKILIALLSLVSGLIFAVFLWTYNEQSVFQNFKLNLMFASIGGSLLGIATFFIYYIEEREVVDAFYGTCMLLSLLGQDATPVTSLGMILVGILSLLSSFLFAVVAWGIIEQLIRRTKDGNSNSERGIQ
jgi:peptidoglycan/LPS O-acetylase OafA/YrhL